MPKSRGALSCSALTGDAVRDPAGEDLGKIEDIMTDLESGGVAYAVLSFGGILGAGNSGGTVTSSSRWVKIIESMVE